MANSTVYHLGGADNESFVTKRKTGWIPLTDMGRNVTVRRFNARYKSPEALTVKLYADGDDATVLWTKSLSANNSITKKYDSVAVGRRANSIMVEVSTSASTSTSLEIGKLEVEVDA